MIDRAREKHIARRLKVLGHPDRIRLLKLLDAPERFPGNLVDVRKVGVCVNDLAKAAELPQSTTSHHLSLMQEVGLVVVTEHGSWRYIRPDHRTLGDLAAAIIGLTTPV